VVLVNTACPNGAFLFVVRLILLGVNLGYHSKKLYPLINDQYTVRPDEAFRFAVGSFIENV
jgi:hypothetical protein